MYFPIGWPKVLRIPEVSHFNLQRISCNRDRILFSILTGDSLGIWFCKVSFNDNILCEVLLNT